LTSVYSKNDILPVREPFYDATTSILHSEERFLVGISIGFGTSKTRLGQRESPFLLLLYMYPDELKEIEGNGI
jgi:hypothetical protein